MDSPRPGDEFLYATRTEGKAGFWELLGFRVGGLGRLDPRLDTGAGSR